MRSIKQFFWGGLVLVTAVWIFAFPGVFQASGLMQLRQFMVQYSGVMAMACMSAAMILAIRSRMIEQWLGGLDKVYRLHKWLGIAALVLAVSHWLWAKGPKWAVSLGLRERGTRPESAPVEDPLQAFFLAYRDTAEMLGEWVFYAAVVLILVALLHRIPYHWFRKLHRVFPLAYLVLVFHAVILFDLDAWLTPMGGLLGLMLAGGTYGALLSLSGRIGARRRVPGTIAKLREFPGVRSLETEIDMAPGWPGHEPGQFAFVTSDPKEGAHPYTIASAWVPERQSITFVTKELGDHTTGLARRLKPGQSVQIEGPYGRFTFDDDAPRQIWVGGGIGITPFIARIKALALGRPAGQAVEVDLFHTTAEVDEDALRRLRDDASAANIRLHVLIDSKDGILTGARIRQAVADWRNASIWFCGPSGFGAALRTDFGAQEFPVNSRFHQELFQMR